MISARRSIRAVLSRLILHIPGADHLAPAPAPMRALRYPARKEGPAQTLLVFLPGISDCMTDFERTGFIEAVQQTRGSVDQVVVDAHIGYYVTRTILDRLHHDICRPAWNQGYKQVWLIGVSLGGFGSLCYARRHPDHVTGVVALAPYLGEATVHREILQSGGLQAWRPDEGLKNEDTYGLWDWFRQFDRQTSTGPKLYLAYGSQDRFAVSHRLLSEILPAHHVFTVPGRHTWKVWTLLWHQLLKSGWLSDLVNQR